jgi:hypothetical protein
MATLLDIAPLIKTIQIRGVDLPVRGITAQGVVYLLNRFPALRMMLTGKTDAFAGMTVLSFIEAMPEVVDTVIACGMGFNGTNPDDQKKAEEIAASFSLDEQVESITAIMEVTLPRGVGPFVDMINRLGLKAEGLGKEVATRLAAQSSG